LFFVPFSITALSFYFCVPLPIPPFPTPPPVRLEWSCRSPRSVRKFFPLHEEFPAGCVFCSFDASLACFSPRFPLFSLSRFAVLGPSCNPPFGKDALPSALRFDYPPPSPVPLLARLPSDIGFLIPSSFLPDRLQAIRALSDILRCRAGFAFKILDPRPFLPSPKGDHS